MSRALCLMLLALSLAGCGGQTLQAPPASPTPTPAAQRILMIRSATLPPSVTYDIIGPLAVRKLSFGAVEWALQQLAQQAREVGANAVADVAISFAPSWLGVANPHGKGVAIRILSPSLEEVANMPEVKLKVEWR